jgi:hypothetical protein
LVIVHLPDGLGVFDALGDLPARLFGTVRQTNGRDAHYEDVDAIGNGLCRFGPTF